MLEAVKTALRRLRPVLTASVRGAVVSGRSGRRNGSEAELKNMG